MYCQNINENEEMDSKESRENDPFESNINKSLQWYRDDLMLMVISCLQFFSWYSLGFLNSQML